MNPVREFMRGLIDDAGIFPPEQLPLAAAIERHARAQGSPEAWILGRFVVKSSSVAQFSGGATVTRLSVVIDHASVHEGFIAARRAHGLPDVIVESVEIPIARGKGAQTESRLSDLATQLVGAGLGDIELFVEVPILSRDGVAEVARAFAQTGRDHGIALYAKVRCGGERVPEPAELASFLRAMHGARVPWKATAGLHHPIAHTDGAGVFAHGFVNLAGAAILISTGAIAEPQAAELLADTDRNHFSFDDAAFAWRSFRASADEISQARRVMFRSFGSCSLNEPIGEFAGMGFLERAVS